MTCRRPSSGSCPPSDVSRDLLGIPLRWLADGVHCMTTKTHRPGRLRLSVRGIPHNGGHQVEFTTPSKSYSPAHAMYQHQRALTSTTARRAAVWKCSRRPVPSRWPMRPRCTHSARPSSLRPSGASVPLQRNRTPCSSAIIPTIVLDRVLDLSGCTGPCVDDAFVARLAESTASLEELQLNVRPPTLTP
jgi:hypothetical protein